MPSAVDSTEPLCTKEHCLETVVVIAVHGWGPGVATDLFLAGKT